MLVHNMKYILISLLFGQSIFTTNNTIKNIDSSLWNVKHQIISFEGSKDQLIEQYTKVCFEHKCVSTEQLLVFISENGK